MAPASPPRKRSRRAAASPKAVNLALQGGGSHGAFAWGILDYLLEDGRLSFEGLCGTSAGSVNAVLCAYGLLSGGREGARVKLHEFWRAISSSGSLFGAGAKMPFEHLLPTSFQGRSLAFDAFKAMTGSLSPYQWNPFNLNPLRDTLLKHVDFDALRTCKVTKLFISATNVRTGKGRVFHTAEIDVNVVLASTCLPQFFQSVEIDGDPYWDGGFMGNPVLYPLFYETVSRDVVIVHINPIERAGTPRLPHEIENRLNEITFNSSLIKELRAVAFVQKLLADGWIKDEHQGKLKRVLIHSIRADKALGDLSVASKFDVSWAFLSELRARGRETAAAWLDANGKDIGTRSTVDVRAEFL